MCDANLDAVVRTFTCDHCGCTYITGWTEEEANAEAIERGGSVLCDTCDLAFMAWYNRQSAEDLARMKAEYQAGLTDG